MPDEREQRKEDYRRRMRALRRWRRFIILCALVACVAVTPALRNGLYDGLHLSELRFGGGLSVRQSLSYWLDTFSANWQSQGTEDILLVSDDGTIIRMEADKISRLGRATQGVRLMRPNPGAAVVAVARTEHEETAEEAPEGENGPETPAES